MNELTSEPIRADMQQVSLLDQMKVVIHLVEKEMPEMPLHAKVYHSMSEVLRIPANRPPGISAIDCMFLFYMHLFRYYFPLVNKDEQYANAAEPMAYCSLITNYIHELGSNKSRRLCIYSVRSFPEIMKGLLEKHEALDTRQLLKALHHVSMIADNIKRHTHPKVALENVPYLRWIGEFFFDQFQKQDIAALTSDETLLSVIAQLEKRERIIRI